MQRFNPIRVLLAGVVLFILVFAGVQLYTWQVRRTGEAELAQTKQMLRYFEKSKKTDIAQNADASTQMEILGEEETFMETDNMKAITDRTAAFIDEAEISATEDVLETFFAEASETENEAAPYGVSPFGFGPYPEIPPDYPDQDIWDNVHGMELYSELVIRTRIALWNQGIRTVGAVRNNTYNLIYPIIDDVVYIKWADNLGADGKPYVQRVLTSPTTDDSYDLHKGIFPPHLTVYEFPDGGIDPYAFLDLPRKGE